jgi:hypothetical protein
MPKLPKQRGLGDLLEPGFANGYEQFKELVDWSQDQSGLTVGQKTWAFCFERVSVAMIEGINTAETRFEIPPHEVVIELWSAIGSALATVNAQAFTTQGMPEVRRQMLQHLKIGYDRSVQGMTEGFPKR